MPTDLYRHFDSDGVLLYVGISLSAVLRLSQHKERAVWRDRIARVEVVSYPTRDEAKVAEAEAIKSEHPRYNIVHSAVRSSTAALYATPIYAHYGPPYSWRVPTSVRRARLRAIRGRIRAILNRDIPDGILIADLPARPPLALAGQRTSFRDAQMSLGIAP
jgi:hypothetical protein